MSHSHSGAFTILQMSRNAGSDRQVCHMDCVKVVMGKSSTTSRWTQRCLSPRSDLPMLVVIFCITLTHAMDRVVPDTQISAEIQDHLYHANIFKHGQVQVRVEHGVATLSGMVDSLGVKEDAQT